MRSLKQYLMFLFACIVASSFHSLGQKKDDHDFIREFIEVNQSYKHLPMQLEMEIRNSTNFVASPQDTLSIKAIFMFQPGSGYLKLGDIEQLITDSMSVLVNESMQRIIIYPQSGSLMDQLKRFTGPAFADSSVLALGKTFTGVKKVSSREKLIIMESRNKLPGDSLAKQVIQMRYDATTKQPLEIISTNRLLIPLSESHYKAFEARHELKDKLLTTANNSHYLVKEQTTRFIYKSISHANNITIPVAISDRIRRNANGTFAPVMAYQRYAVIMN